MLVTCLADLKDGVQIRNFKDKLFSYKEIRDLIENLLQRAENVGYPFAAIRLHQIGDRSGQIEAKVEVKLNEQIKIERIKN